MANLWKLSPSDLTFLWSECPRCFYLKMVHNFDRPRMPFPSIFNRIDKLMKDHFEMQPASALTTELPEGYVRFGERWVTSQPVFLPDERAGCFIRGKFDTVVEFTDGSYGVIDFKTTQPKPEHVAFYSRQLHAYAYALEHPAPGGFNLNPISRLGLLCVEPVLMEKSHDDRVAYLGEVTWLECPKDEVCFLTFIEEVLELLARPIPPESHPECGWCRYRESARIAPWQE